MPGPFAERPWIAIWEITRACDLACAHCRAQAQPLPDPDDLDPAEARDLLRQLAEWKVPLVVFTGGDPLKRPDILEIVAEAARRGLHVGLAPSVTPLLTRSRLMELRKAGLQRLALSLDGADAATHDGFRGIRGIFERTLEAFRWAVEEGIPLQVNTTLSRINAPKVWDMARLLRNFSPELWSVFFLVPTGRGRRAQALDARETEEALQHLFDVLQEGWFDVKTTEAPQFRRVVLQRCGIRPENLSRVLVHRPDPVLAHVARGVNDGRGFVFISHRGGVFPSGFLPLAAGTLRERPLAEIYREAPLFQALRDPDRLKGKCGACEYRAYCGGSRARAFAFTGDPLASDPSCPYQPPSFKAEKGMTGASL